MTLTATEVWCPGCVPGDCVYGPCAKPGESPAINGTIKLDVSSPAAPNPAFDVWRLNEIEGLLLKLCNYENQLMRISCRYGTENPWQIRYGDYGAEVSGRSLREVLDYYITMLHETVGSYEGGDEEEDEDDDYEEDPEPF